MGMTLYEKILALLSIINYAESNPITLTITDGSRSFGHVEVVAYLFVQLIVSCDSLHIIRSTSQFNVMPRVTFEQANLHILSKVYLSNLSKSVIKKLDSATATRVLLSYGQQA